MIKSFGRDHKIIPSRPHRRSLIPLNLDRAAFMMKDFLKANTIQPNICDDKRGLAKYLRIKLPEICDDKRHLTLNTAELLPNMCDNHHRLLIVTNIGLCCKKSLEHTLNRKEYCTFSLGSYAK
jgi:hypothetical protein